jgi:outer membrane protein assembly factor BamB
MTGCSVLDSLKSDEAKRSFQIHNQWVKRTTEKDNLGFRKINRMRPTFYKDWVIQANGLDGIAAYDQISGQEIWRLKIENGVEASVAIINDRIFFGANDGQFYSVFAETGKVLWTFPIRIEGLSEPLLADGNVYFMTGNNSLYALDAATVKQLWLYSRQDTAALSIRGGSKPFLRNGTLYAGFSDGSMVALLASNGALSGKNSLIRIKNLEILILILWSREIFSMPWVMTIIFIVCERPREIWSGPLSKVDMGPSCSQVTGFITPAARAKCWL